MADMRWLEVIPDAIPALLRERPRWVLWRAAEREGKITKIPYRIAYPSRTAAVDQPETWGSFHDAIAALSCPELGVDGIGYVLTEEDGLVGVDLDHVRHRDTGAIDPLAQAIIDRLASYSETSPSGTGVRIFVRGSLPGQRRRKGNVEMYTSGRFLTVTGHVIAGALL